MQHSVPSFFRDGCYLFSLDGVEETEAFLSNQLPLIQAKIATLQSVYDVRIEEARQILSVDGLFDLAEYPTHDELPTMFGWDYQWVAFTVPEGLPPGIREQAIRNMENMWEESAVSIRSALREGFRELVTHAVEKLAPSQDGKRKVMRETFVANFNTFLETFNNRNLTNDDELAKLVQKAQDVMYGITSTGQLKSEAVKRVIRNELLKVQTMAGDMVIDRPRRRLNLREDEDNE